jgi:hypothetical protein
MPDITNPQAIRVANEKLRPLADRFGQLYNYCKMLQAESQAEGWGAMFPNTADVITDGAAGDGRSVITGADVTALINMTATFLNYMEANANANRNLSLRIAVNPERI